MCGRYSIFLSAGAVAERFDLAVPDHLEHHHNAAPSQSLPVVTNTTPTASPTSGWACSLVGRRGVRCARQRPHGDGGGDVDHAADDASIESFTVVTTEANEYQADYHDRMPVILDRDEEREWLADPDPDLLDPDGGDRRAYPVSTAVNDPSNDSPVVVEPVDG